MNTQVVIRLLGIIVLVVGCYCLAEGSDNLVRSNVNVESKEVSNYKEVQNVENGLLAMANVGEHKGEFTNQWKYIFSDPMYVLLIIIAVFLNVVLLRKLAKEEL